jgi:hypothetical protein
MPLPCSGIKIGHHPGLVKGFPREFRLPPCVPGDNVVQRDDIIELVGTVQSIMGYHGGSLWPKNKTKGSSRSFW